jgi:hypothetical protein
VCVVISKIKRARLMRHFQRSIDPESWMAMRVPEVDQNRRHDNAQDRREYILGQARRIHGDNHRRQTLFSTPPMTSTWDIARLLNMERVSL